MAKAIISILTYNLHYKKGGRVLKFRLILSVLIIISISSSYSCSFNNYVKNDIIIFFDGFLDQYQTEYNGGAVVGSQSNDLPNYSWAMSIKPSYDMLSRIELLLGECDYSPEPD